MNFDLNILQESLCKMMCAEIKLRKKNDHLVMVETPFFFSDGDPYQIFIKEMPGGIIRISDSGHTMLHLSYENDIDKFKDGTRGNIFSQILSENELKYENGEFFIDTTINNMVFSLFRFGQGLTKVGDLTFLNRARAESTFYDDLFERLTTIVSAEKIHKDYIYNQMENAKDYPIDFYIETPKTPLYVFGIPGRDKARLTTIVLERLLRAEANFDSLLIFADQAAIPRPDIARLSNAGGEMIASLDAQEDMSRKISRKIEAN